jgi:hypothetical protein
VSKNLGNIPKQEKMTEEQEQTFTNGINKGRKLEREDIIKLLESYRCKCLDLTGDELRAFIDSEENKLKHLDCFFVGIDWVIDTLRVESKSITRRLKIENGDTIE